MSNNSSHQSNSLNVTGSHSGVIVTPVIALSAVGVAINMAAFTYLVYSPRIRRPLKVALFNLVVSDCIFLFGVLVRSLLYWSNTDVRSGCPVVTIMIMIPSPISYSAVLGLAGYNFLAVYKATQFSSLVTTQKAVIVTAVSWTLILVISVLSVFLGGKQDPQCSLLSRVPSFVLVLFAVYCLICSFGMAVLNIVVAIKLRSARSIGSSTKDKPVQQGFVTSTTFLVNNNSHLPQLLSVPKPLSRTHHRPAEAIVSSGNEAPFSPPQLRSDPSKEPIDGYTDKRTSNLSLQINETTQSTNINISSIDECSTQDAGQNNSGTVHEQKYEPLRETLDGSFTNNKLRFQEGTYIETSRTVNVAAATDSEDKASSVGTTAGILKPAITDESKKEVAIQALSDSPSLGPGRLFATRESKSCTQNKDMTKVKGREEVKSHQIVQGSCTSKKVKTVMTLTILASWNAVLTLPILGMWIWMATVTDMRSEAAYQGVSNVLPFLAAFNAVSNPFMYAWRFVNWRRVYVRCCKRGRADLFAVGSFVGDSRQQSRIG